jgi:phosphoadenosine phosphosulfate reductase
LDFAVDSSGISPNQIFGIARDEMQTILLNLSTKYPEFINTSFTHDLDKISLTENIKSNDVLDLFK